MSVLMIVHDCGTHYSAKQFWWSPLVSSRRSTL